MNIEGMKKAQAMETLIRGGKSYAEAEAYWKEHGSKRAKGFTNDFLALLEESPMADGHFEDLIAEQSANVQNHKSLYNNIRLMANAIWDNK